MRFYSLKNYRLKEQRKKLALGQMWREYGENVSSEVKKKLVFAEKLKIRLETNFKE